MVALFAIGKLSFIINQWPLHLKSKEKTIGLVTEIKNKMVVTNYKKLVEVYSPYSNKFTKIGPLK